MAYSFYAFFEEKGAGQLSASSYAEDSLPMGLGSEDQAQRKQFGNSENSPRGFTLYSFIVLLNSYCRNGNSNEFKHPKINKSTLVILLPFTPYKTELMDQDIRWQQRLQNYGEALKHLKSAVTEIEDPSDLEKEGTIQRFEFTHELAWKVMRDYLEYEGITGITGSRSATRQAFNKGLISEGQKWMDMIESRNITVHTYRGEILEREYRNIVKVYYPLFEAFNEKMQKLL